MRRLSDHHLIEDDREPVADEKPEQKRHDGQGHDGPDNYLNGIHGQENTRKFNNCSGKSGPQARVLDGHPGGDSQ